MCRTKTSILLNTFFIKIWVFDSALSLELTSVSLTASEIHTTDCNIPLVMPLKFFRIWHPENSIRKPQDEWSRERNKAESIFQITWHGSNAIEKVVDCYNGCFALAEKYYISFFRCSNIQIGTEKYYVSTIY